MTTTLRPKRGRNDAAAPAPRRRSGMLLTCVTAALLPAAACERAPAPTGSAPAAQLDGGADTRLAELEERFRPGLHSLMVDLQFRHGSLGLAGGAENWALADYHMHEIEELVGDVVELHPTYDEIPVAELTSALLVPAIHDLAAAVDDGDVAAFEMAYDRLTAQCNACHQASDRGMIVIQRPAAHPFDNIRYAPVQ